MTATVAGYACETEGCSLSDCAACVTVDTQADTIRDQTRIIAELQSKLERALAITARDHHREPQAVWADLGALTALVEMALSDINKGGAS